MKIRGNEGGPPDAGTTVAVEAATDGRVYFSALDSDGRGLQLVLSPAEADSLAANLADKAARVRRWLETN